MSIAPVTLFDTYSYRARLIPALLALLPGLLTVMLLYPTVYGGLGSTVVSVMLASGVLWFLANVVRARGHLVEQVLVKSLGGLPTTQMLRHRDGSLDSQTRDRYHRFLTSHVPGLRLPTAEQERRDPAAADAAYRSGVKWLLEFTRDRRRFPMIFAENIAYGFRRNLYAAKPIGLGLTVACMTLVAWSTASAWPSRVSEISASRLLLSLLLVLIATCWVFVTTTAWVLDASRGYAAALLAACDATVDSSAIRERTIIAP
jgi:hypothetical protein